MTSPNLAWAEAYLHTKWHLDPSTTDGPKIGGLCAFWEGELGPHLTQCGQGRDLPHVKFHLDPSNRLATMHQCHRQKGQTGRQAG